MTTIRADEIRPGDVVVYGGDRHRIARVDRRDGWAWPVAADGTGWAIALDNELIDVHPTPAHTARRHGAARVSEPDGGDLELRRHRVAPRHATCVKNRVPTEA